MKSNTIVLALAAGASANLAVRDAATVLSDIQGIQGQVESLTTAVNGYNSIADAQPLIDAEMQLAAAIQKGASDAQGTSTLSLDDGNSILSAVAALIPDIVSALNAVVAKYPTFGAVSSVVDADLVSLKSDTDTFAAALVAIAPAEAQDSANAAVSCIDAAFVAAQATMSADAGCVAGVTTVGGGSGPTTTAGPTDTATPTGTVTPTSTPTDTAIPTGTGSTTPMSTPTGPVGTGTGYPYPTGVYPTSGLPYSNSGASVKVGMSGAALAAALAMVL